MDGYITSGSKKAKIKRMAAGTTWMARGALQDLVEFSRPVAIEIPAEMLHKL